MAQVQSQKPLRVWWAVLVLAFGFALGCGAVLYLIIGQPINTRKSNQSWMYSKVTGSERADPFWRAGVALFGIWALRSEETMYVQSETDTNGTPIDLNCTYRVVGDVIDTRWWSLTAYQGNHFVPNPGNRYSWSKTSIAYEPDGSWVVTVSAKPQPGNWLPVDPNRPKLSLSLRLYNPSQSLREGIATAKLPRVEKVSCP